VPWLNELEYVDGQLWANIFGQDRIARIDPLSGDVLSWLDFSGMFETHPGTLPSAVMNGIAFDADSGRIFVTGKLWPKCTNSRQSLCRSR
jgi:Glutamine cyclotransferase